MIQQFWVGDLGTGNEYTKIFRIFETGFNYAYKINNTYDTFVKDTYYYFDNEHKLNKLYSEINLYNNKTKIEIIN